METVAPGAEATTVQVRVQVVDMTSQTLDLVLPTYLPAKDLTQRVARDAGLVAFWPDGRRRLYWLRARGRLMGNDERLMDLGVVPHELVYLLPEPPAGSGVLEQPPDYPETRGYAAKGVPALVGALVLAVVWSVAWGVALSWSRSLPVVMVPGLALGMMTCSLSRHAFGGSGARVRVGLVGMMLAVMLVALAFLPAVILGEDFRQVYAEAAPGLVTALVGVMVAWLAWWGAVEPLPPRQVQVVEQVAEAAPAVACGICGIEAAADVRVECPYRCGRHFHTGCYTARTAVARGKDGLCAVCNARVG